MDLAKTFLLFKRILWIIFYPYNYLFFSLYHFFKSLNAGEYNSKNTHGIRIYSAIFIMAILVSTNISFLGYFNNFNLLFAIFFFAFYLVYTFSKDQIYAIKQNTIWGKFIMLLLIIETYWVIGR